jgi:hypothetical protein
MAQYDNTNSGVLFKNKNKTSDRQPDYRGNIDVEGTTYWISGWIKVSGPSSKNPGEKFMSLAVSRQESKRQGAADDFDDDIPF